MIAASTSIAYRVWEGIRTTGLAELTGIITAIAYVLLAARANKWCWIFGIISSGIYVWFFIDLCYYYDAILNIYYVLIGFYGWYVWTRKDKAGREEVNVTRSNSRTIMILLLIGITSTFLFGYGGPPFAEWLGDVFHQPIAPFRRPFVDAALTSFSFIATWMTTRKLIENWLLWIIIDLCNSYVCYISDRPSTSLLMLFYTIIAIFGFLKWKRTIK